MADPVGPGEDRRLLVAKVEAGSTAFWETVLMSLLSQTPLPCSEHDDAAGRTFTSRLWPLMSRR